MSVNTKERKFKVIRFKERVFNFKNCIIPEKLVTSS